MNKTSAAILKQSSGCINFKRVRRSKREGETDRDRDKDKKRQNNGESLSARVLYMCMCVTERRREIISTCIHVLFVY